MKLTVRDNEGAARLILIDDRHEIIGIANMSWIEYQMTVRLIARAMLETAKNSIAATLRDRLWADAQRLVPMGDGAAEAAAEKLLEFGWNQELIDSYASTLAKELTSAMVSKLPEHQ